MRGRNISQPTEREKRLASNVLLFKEYHLKYPSHGYRWLNAKIRLDKGLTLSDPYAHKCCRIAGIKSKSKHYRYKTAGNPKRIFPNAEAVPGTSCATLMKLFALSPAWLVG